MRGRLRVPPVVGQLVASLPDGAVDPAAMTDCGESCVTSAVQAFRGLYIGPGCVRQGMGKPSTDGRTTGWDVSDYAWAVGLKAAVKDAPAGRYIAYVRSEIRRGRLVMLLGTWDGAELHWVLGYHAGKSAQVWAMDPWTASHRALNFPTLVRDNCRRVVSLWR